MCGIFALFLDDMGNIDHELIEKYFNMIKGRGPDDTQLKCFKQTAKLQNSAQYMGFHRLAINGLDAISNQPLELEDMVLICNGEIYNHAALRDENNFVYKSNSDCEIILHLYKKYGCDFVNLLDGVFAFILYDRGNQKVIVARDPIGVRPLFYQIQGHKIAFASEAKSLVGLNECIGGKTAPFKHFDTNSDVIQQFPAGNYMTFDLNRYSAPRMYEFHPYLHENFYGTTFKYDNDCAANIILQTRKLLSAAVEKRLMSDRPIGCLLSGGVDSSVVAALLCKYYQGQGKNIKTFSIGFEDSTDLKYARIVADHIGSEHHEIRLNYTDAIARIPDVIRDIETYDITTIRASAGMYLLAEYISKNFEEIVIFSGEGSDELLAGYLYFHYAPTTKKLENESVRLIKNLPWFDVLRADRCTATHGLELRVPFLDKHFVQFCLNIAGEAKQPQNNIEKYYLRKAFEDLLPHEVIWRRKEGFSDGVGGLSKPWYRWIQEDIESKYPDDMLIESDKVSDLVKKFPSKEAWFYYYTFTEYYGKLLKPIPHYWMPQWQKTNDPSGRMMEVFNEK